MSMSSLHRIEAAETLLQTHPARSAAGPMNGGKLTLAKVRAILMPHRKILLGIQLACILLYVIAIFGMFANEGAAPLDSDSIGLARRTVLNGERCAHQRPQINVFMASFFGGMFAADQLYARNWQLAVPKILFFFLGGLIAVIGTAFTGLSLHFAWWLIDVVMWGVGYYTTDTHWSSPIKGCAVKGW